MIAIIIEYFTFLATIVLALLWIFYPDRNIEPWIIICGLIGSGIELYRRYISRKTKKGKYSIKAENLLAWIQENGLEQPLSKVLPRALQLAVLIKDENLEHWIRLELYGYYNENGITEQDIVPVYREVTGRYIDHYNRILQISDPELDFINGYRFRNSVKQLEELASKTDMQNIRDEGYIDILHKNLNVDVCRFCFSPIEITGVLNKITNVLLEKVHRLNINASEETADL